MVRVGEHTVLQTVGVPMGGPPCAQYLDVYLDHYEHLLMLRVWDSLLSGCSSARRHALHVIKLMQYCYRYADVFWTLKQMWQSSYPRVGYEVTICASLSHWSPVTKRMCGQFTTALTMLGGVLGLNILPSLNIAPGLLSQ